MLYKSALKEIPLITLDKIKMGKLQYLGVAQIVDTEKCGEVFVLDVHTRQKPKELVFRFYSDGKTYQVYDVKEAKWQQKTLYASISKDSYYHYGYVGEKYRIAASETSIETAKEFFDMPQTHRNTIIEVVDDFVRNVEREKRERAWDRKQERIEGHMKMFPDTPKDFNDYLRKDVFNKYLFVGKKIKGIKQGVCTNCGKKVKITPPVKHKGFIKCPKCGETVILFEERFIDSIKEKQRVCLANRVDGRLLFEWMWIYCSWYIDKNGKYKPSYQNSSYYRTLNLFENKKEKTIHYEYKSVYPYGADWRKKTDVCDDLSYVYNGNLAEVFGNKYYNVDLDKELKENHQPLRFMKLLDNLKSLPPTEYLFKMGMYRLASELHPEDLNSGRDFKSILGVNPQYKKMYAERNVSRDEHDIIKSARDWVSDDDFMKLRRLRPNSAQVRIIIEMLQTMTFKRFVNYFTSQRKVYRRETLDQILLWYRDYIQMSEQMKVNLSHKSVRFPKDIKQAHDRLLAEYKAVENEILDEQLKQATERLYSGLTEYKNGGYAIVFPRTKTEFIVEGQSLNHCVGTNEMYFNNHMKGTRMIFFIRKETDIKTPFVTMEIDMERLIIQQIYGYSDKRPAQDVINFANKFLTLLKKDTAVAGRAC